MLVAAAGVDADELGAFADLDFFEDADVLAAAALLLEADRLEGLHVGERGAVEDGQLEVVDLDDDVVDAVADERGEQMLGGGDEHALAHEAGGVADLGDVAAGGGDLEVVEVGAAEDDAGAGGRGDEPHADGRAAVQADAAEGDLRPDGPLKVWLACHDGSIFSGKNRTPPVMEREWLDYSDVNSYGCGILDTGEAKSTRKRAAGRV